MFLIYIAYRLQNEACAFLSGLFPYMIKMGVEYIKRPPPGLRLKPAIGADTLNCRIPAF